MKILGIDEAGRGAVLGPLVVAGAYIEEKQIKILKRMGVKDSKRLTPNRRKVLSRKLKKITSYEIIPITAKDIDTLRQRNVNLNEIEKMGIHNIITKINPEKIIIDSLDVKPERLREEIKITVNDNVEVISEHKADDHYISVASASILAKVERDLAIEKLQKEYRDYGDIGSGYPSDPRTKEFLSNFTYDTMPECVRRSWATIENMR